MNKSNKRRFSKNKKTRKQKGGHFLNDMSNKFDDLKKNTFNLLPEKLRGWFETKKSDTFSTSASPPASPPAPPPAPPSTPLGGNKTRKNRTRKNRRNK